jgi:hypothetical protein
MLRHIKEIVLTGVLAALIGARAQAAPEDSLVSRLLDRLEALQVRQDDFFYPGTFPTLRAWGGTPGTLKEDNSIFYTGLVVFTLRQLRPLLSEAERGRCDSILARAVRAYPYYRNTRGRPTYNFWPTAHPVFFPHSLVLDHFKGKDITDDLDDTSILWMGEGIPDSTAHALKALMEAHAGGPGRPARSSYRAVRDLSAYSAWFGVKTPTELDAGVLCNVLYFVRASGLRLTVQDSATEQFLRYIVAERKYWKDPAFASTYYPRTPVLLYHLSRLMGRFTIDSLEPYRPQLIQDTRRSLARARDGMERVILATALMRLGDTATTVATSDDMEGDEFPFYIANISSLFPRPIRRLTLHAPFCIFHFYCPAYNDALVLEYLVLRRSLSGGMSSTPILR